MTPEQQRIAIAEACGWKSIDSRRWGGYTDVYQCLCSPSDAVGAPAKYWGYIPDYLNSLDAMHEAEKAMAREQRIIYLRHLHCTPGLSSSPFATAAQRAEAFLKTLGLWKE